MRARTRNLLLLAALLAAAGLALLLLPDGGRAGGGEGPRETAAGKRPAPIPGRRAAARPPAPGGEGVAGSAVPDGPHLDLRAVVERDWGLSGIEVLALERLSDGSVEAWVGDDAPDGGETDADGRITLRYKTEPRERLFAVVGDGEVLGTVENAEAAGEVHGLRAFRAKSTAPVTLSYRDKEGVVLLRPVDAATGEILSRRAGVALAWTWVDEDGTSYEEARETGEKAPGWLRADAGEGPEARDLRLIVPGFLPFPAPEGGWKGRVVLPLKPDPEAVRGRIVLPAGTLVRVELLGASDGRPCDAPVPVGLPATGGPFVLGGVPLGEWDLVVQAAGDGGARGRLWATRRFTFQGKGLDLGDLVPQRGSVVRSRLLSLEGNPVDDGGLRLYRAVPGAIPQLSYYRSPRSRPSVGVSWPGRDGSSSSEEGEAGEGGWVEFAGLLPGARFLLATPMLPGLTREVTSPSKPEEVLSVDIDGGCPMTPCVLHVTLEGEEAAFWGSFCGPAFSDQFSTGKGTLEAMVPPGRHRLLVEGSRGPEPDFKEYIGEVEIPEGGRFEATVDLKLRRP